jgi:hypothetical protein
VGSDGFTLKGDDGHGEFTALPINVSVVNNQPSCNSTTGTPMNHTPLAVTLSCTDADGDPVSYQVTGTDGGTVSGTAPNLTFTPTGDAVGGQITYIGSDGFTPPAAQTNTHTVKMNIPANQGPFCKGESLHAETPRRSTVTLTPICPDPEGDAVTMSNVRPECGTATINGATISYTNTGQCPRNDTQDLFKLTVSDGHDGSPFETTGNIVFFDPMVLAPDPDTGPDYEWYLTRAIKAITDAAAHKLPGSAFRVPIASLTDSDALKIVLKLTYKGVPAGHGSLWLSRRTPKGTLSVELSKKARKVLAKKGKLKVATAVTVSIPARDVTLTRAGTLTLKAKKKG